MLLGDDCLIHCFSRLPSLTDKNSYFLCQVASDTILCSNFETNQSFSHEDRFADHAVGYLKRAKLRKKESYGRFADVPTFCHVTEMMGLTIRTSSKNRSGFLFHSTIITRKFFCSTMLPTTRLLVFSKQRQENQISFPNGLRLNIAWSIEPLVQKITTVNKTHAILYPALKAKHPYAEEKPTTTNWMKYINMFCWKTTSVTTWDRLLDNFLAEDQPKHHNHFVINIWGRRMLTAILKFEILTVICCVSHKSTLAWSFRV